MEIDFKALAAGLGAAALMAFGAHAHTHKQGPDSASQAPARNDAKAPQPTTGAAPAPSSAAGR
jgi:hypothetical protein